MAPEAATRTFFCPHCGEKLSFLDGTVIKLDGVLSCDTFSVRTQFYFAAELGQYGAIVAGNVEVREGAKVEFHCIRPRCGKNLTAPYNSDLAEIRMVDEGGGEYVVVFNKIHGRRATFVVDPERQSLVSRFGRDADSYADTFERPLNFFGAV
jgi:predicted RNA-binding Zn-ribbon protein involved in translation (DUF1610 family)